MGVGSFWQRTISNEKRRLGEKKPRTPEKSYLIRGEVVESGLLGGSRKMEEKTDLKERRLQFGELWKGNYKTSWRGKRS